MLDRPTALREAAPAYSLCGRIFRRRGLPHLVVAGVTLAAGLALATLITGLPAHREEQPVTILVDAAAARRHEEPAIERLAGMEIRNAATVDAAVRRAVGQHARAPDLAALHWRLVELETYRSAAALHYRGDAGLDLTIYLRLKRDVPRFAMLKDGNTRICIWQNEAAGAVIMGDLSAGQMMRVASATYLALDW